MFSSVIKDIKGSKAKPDHITDAEDVRRGIEELSTIFSVANFPLEPDCQENYTMDEDEVELDIGIYVRPPDLYSCFHILADIELTSLFSFFLKMILISKILERNQKGILWWKP